MSDFLSKFSGDKYTELLETDQKNPENESKELEKNSVVSASSEDEAHQIPTVISAVDTDENGLSSQSVNLETPEEAPVRYDRAKKRRDDFHEEVEIDPTYQKKKKRKLVILVASVSLAILVIAFSAYHFTHVTLPNFVGKSITEVREWGNQHQVTIDLTQKYSTKYDANFIISQKTKAGKKIAKGSQLGVVSSLGADPEEVLKLPDFSKMTYSQAVKWVEKNKAENLKVSQEFNETIKKGEFIKLDIANSVPASEYTRGTKATLTYSRGAEVLEANISVPDFNGKQKSEVESWAKTNGIEVTYVEKASSTIATGLVMGQSVVANEKVAKKSKMEITVSAGKGVTVPDFSQITMGQASSVSGLTVIVRQVYGDKPYGQLISQSQPAGTELTEKDNRNVEVVYSAGTPYIRDLTGKNEGELQQYFYEEFRSKGAEIYFSSYYVNSDQPKGTVVKQSAEETWLPLNYTVNVGISNGAWYTGAPVPTPSTDKSTSDSGETQTAD
ncbi:PASTA domain-containing protein [Streptococcus orisratti]|uniref:PASTA domain-containing protein n=1 Tax=Streptococcus orisratti TaxID=114652 RepID=UPI000374DDA0|nr:PASTA domain-containing protein [Streptococcus orisratti]